VYQRAVRTSTGWPFVVCDAMSRVRAGHSCDPLVLQVRLLIACLSIICCLLLITVA